ncbi:MaoC family dehydratase [Niveispirillum fermenti]|uniref:MaoC family dehydratase n=1 Tax=Niveispirillum fermenti TaxID=1233113 RepID=UPI003A85A04F
MTMPPPTVGSELPAFTVTVSARTMCDWALYLRDPNPIHLDPDFVRARGLGDRVINQGPANLAYIINMLAGAFPGARIASLESRFVDNAYDGDRLTAGGRVVETDGRQAICDVWLTADGDRPIIQGRAVILPPP